MKNLANKVTKLEKNMDTCGDWRQRVARKEAKAWVEGLEIMYASVMEMPPRSEDEIYLWLMKGLESFETEAAYRENYEAGEIPLNNDLSNRNGKKDNG